MSTQDSQHSHADAEAPITPFSDATYIRIWLALLVLTGVTVTATALRLGNFSLMAAIAVALVKASLVVLIFMNIARGHLIFKIMLAVALATLAVIIGLTFFDVAFR